MMCPEEGKPCHADTQGAARHLAAAGVVQPGNSAPAQRTTPHARSLLPSPARRRGWRSDGGAAGPSRLFRTVRHLSLDGTRYPQGGPVQGRQRHQDLRRHRRAPTHPGGTAAAVGHRRPAVARSDPRQWQRRPPYHPARPAEPYQRPLRLHRRHLRPPGLRHRGGPCRAGPPSDEHPGRYAYSNTNYVVLGLVIRRVTGHGYATEIRHRIITPSASPVPPCPAPVPRCPPRAAAASPATRPTAASATSPSSTPARRARPGS